jgi:hypothetical protein
MSHRQMIFGIDDSLKNLKMKRSSQFAYKNPFIVPPLVNTDEVSTGTRWLLSYIEGVRKSHINVYGNELHHAIILKEEVDAFLSKMCHYGVILSYSSSLKGNVLRICYSNKNQFEKKTLEYKFVSNISDHIYYLEATLMKSIFDKIDDVAKVETERFENLKYEFVLLKGLERGNRFFTTNSIRPERLWNGEIGYKILGYANTVEGAQQKLYGGMNLH